MGFLKDTINVKIFLLVVLAIVAMASLVVVFQRNFEDINERYREKVLELNATFENLTGAQLKLNKTLTDLELKSIKETDLKNKYSELKNERDTLEDEVNRLNVEITEKETKIKSLNDKIISLESDIDKLNSKIEKLQKRVDCFKSGGSNC